MNKHLTIYRSASAVLAVEAMAVVSACGRNDAATAGTEAAPTARASEEAVATTATDVEVTMLASEPDAEADTDPRDEETDDPASGASNTTEGQMIANCSFGSGGPDSDPEKAGCPAAHCRFAQVNRCLPRGLQRGR